MQALRQPFIPANRGFNPSLEFHTANISETLNQQQAKFSVLNIYGNTKIQHHQIMDTKSIRLANLQTLISRFSTQSKFAEAVDTAPAYISQILSTEHPANLGAQLARKIESKLGLEHGWIDREHKGENDAETAKGIYPRTPSTEDYALIPQYSTKGACGTGFFNDHVEVIGGLTFKRAWLERLGIDEHQACVIYATGDSMIPTIQDGDVVLIDQASTPPRTGEVYAILMDDEVIIKRLSKEFGMLLLRSDNANKAAFPDITVPPGHDLQVIGRVVWRGGGL
ncbi:helix-turn-helix transcriptional regulator [Chitinibacter sp. S2-10]|uniref:S24 family peptidase n=1 Tax=Chitinibacter sp. S2-10 TaxID=3373597 RepID=UPI003977A3D0